MSLVFEAHFVQLSAVFSHFKHFLTQFIQFGYFAHLGSEQSILVQMSSKAHFPVFSFK